MKKYTGFLLATAGGIALAPGAQAADLPMKARGPAYAPPPPVASWEGPYIGVHVGVYWHHSDVSESPGYAPGGVSNTGFIGGGQIGYNWQRGYFVYGVEADISGLTGSAKGFGGENPPTKDVKTRIEWLSTFRGRTGLAVGDTMAYVTAGLAVGGVNNELVSSGIKSESKTRVGWAVGGGVEHMWNRNWTIALEGLFVDLGNSTAGSTSGEGKKTKFSNQAIIGRFKLNYKW
jgi:outer membrane immunogenic protein